MPSVVTPAPRHPHSTGEDARARWITAFRDVRGETERRAAPLSPEDQIVQSMPDASPTKWHRAHTTWFFEQFLLGPNVPGYRPFDDRFAFLFNSYYVSAGPRHERPNRGLITRPNAQEVSAYRASVDDAVETLIAGASDADMARLAPIIEVGLNHEQQHQELLLTDILHAFAQNPTCPTYDAQWQPPPTQATDEFVAMGSGIHRIGHLEDGFSFDNESPAHQVLLQPVAIGKGLVTNAAWQEFMTDGGYETPTLWLSEGWATVEGKGWKAPGYWRRQDGAWHALTLGGLRPVAPHAPVTHIGARRAISASLAPAINVSTA
ncbi:MAG: ergothioneine biosynthesis protein EgtB, partial [Variibacter sp.]